MQHEYNSKPRSIPAGNRRRTSDGIENRCVGKMRGSRAGGRFRRDSIVLRRGSGLLRFAGYGHFPSASRDPRGSVLYMAYYTKILGARNKSTSRGDCLWNSVFLSRSRPRLLLDTLCRGRCFHNILGRIDWNDDWQPGWSVPRLDRLPKATCRLTHPLHHKFHTSPIGSAGASTSRNQKTLFRQSRRTEFIPFHFEVSCLSCFFISNVTEIVQLTTTSLESWL